MRIHGQRPVDVAQMDAGHQHVDVMLTTVYGPLVDVLFE
jgi:hypothetical protein